MADLDVAVRLKFLTDGEGKLKAAAKNFDAFGKSVNQLSGRGSARFAGDLNKAWHASVKLGGSLDKGAKAAGKTASGLRAIGTGAGGVDRTRAAVDRLTKSTNALGAAERKVRLNAAASRGGGVVAAGAMGGAMARRKAALKEGFAEAATRVSPGAGYLIGAGGAVALGAAFGGTAAAGLAIAARSTKEVIDRQVAFTQVQKKVNLEGRQSWQDIDRQIAKVSRTLGIAYQDAAAMFDTGGGGGIGGKDLESFAMLAGKVAMAWDISNREAALGLVQTRAQLQKSIPDLEAFADKINYLSDISAAAERDVFNMSQRAIAGMKAAGVNEDQSLALMTGLRSVGMDDEVGARFLNSFTMLLRRATTLKDVKQEALKTLGLDPKAVERGMQVNAMKTIVDLFERLGKAKNAVAVANDLLGAQWADESMIMKDALPEIVRVYEALRSGKWRNSMTGAMDLQLSTIDAKMKRFWQGFIDTGATQFKGAADLIDKTLDRLIASQDRVLKWAEDKRVLDKDWNRERLSEDEAKRIASDPDLRAKFDAQQPSGRSSDTYAHDLKLDRPIPKALPLPLFQQIEGNAPHIARTKAWGKSVLDASQFSEVARKVTGEAGDLFNALQNLDTTVSPQLDTSIISNIDAVQAKVNALNNSLNALKNFGSSSFSAPSTTRVWPTLTGAPPKGSGGSTGGGASAPATPGKQSRLGRGGVQIGTAHFHGVKDPRAMHRQLAALDRRIRSARDGALHDIG